MAATSGRITYDQDSDHGDPGQGYGHGSNVDLGDRAEIDFELKRRIVEIDESLEALREASKIRAEAKSAYEESYADAYERASKTTDKVTRIKGDAERECVSFKVRVIRADAAKEWAEAANRARQSQLSAAQTRANLLMKQWDLDTRGPR